jgi:flavin-dependent dehydrogenase
MMTTEKVEFDVIIVGGRAAGATLAARLGQMGLRILLIERARMPSPPGASCPIIYASTMALLDEIGADEADYARNTPPIRRMVNVGQGMDAVLRIPEAHGRDYAYAIDRARFDGALWAHAARQPGVTARDGASLIDLLWHDGAVVGALIQHEGERKSIGAELVIGADGRFSTVARKAGAEERDAHDDHPTTLYYAYWRGVAPLDADGPAAVAYGEGDGCGYLVMDSADDTHAVAIEGRADLLEPPAGKIEPYYLDLLRRNTVLWSRLRRAERVTEVRGMRKVGNLYRSPGGAGWALVGDAYHQKDPIDGQGIYDAVYTAKLLAQAIADWRAGDRSWAQALAWYDAAARAETFPMYRSTLERVRASLYSSSPEWLNGTAGRTIARWILQDRVCQEQIGMLLTRQVPADRVMSAPVVLGALLRGPLRDLSDLLDRQLREMPPAGAQRSTLERR